MKIYGPYKRKDGRQHIIIVHDDGSKQTKSYPRYLYEQYTGIELSQHEHIDHINNDFTDNRIENLQVLTQIENNKKEYNRPHRQRKLYTFNCPVCNRVSSKRLSQVVSNKNKGKSGPYCSRHCAGIASH